MRASFGLFEDSASNAAIAGLVGTEQPFKVTSLNWSECVAFSGVLTRLGRVFKPDGRRGIIYDIEREDA